MPDKEKINIIPDQKKDEEQSVVITDSPKITKNHFGVLSKGGWWVIRETLVVFCALLIMGIGFICWKLSQGPVPLNFITPHLEKEFHNRFPNLKSSLGGTSLIWQKNNMSLNLQTKNIELYENNSPLMVISSADIGISMHQIIKGKLRINSLNFTGLAFRIHKNKNETYSLILGNEGEDTTNLTLPITQNIDNTTKPFSVNIKELLSHLKRVSFKDTDIVFEDLTKNKIWHSASIDAFLIRGKNSITGTVKSNLFLDNDEIIHTKLNTNISYNTSSDELKLTTFFKELNPTSLSKKFPEFPELSMLNLPLSGKLDILLDDMFYPSKIEAEIYSPKGQISINGVYNEPVNIRNLKTYFNFTKQNKTLVLEQLSLDFEENSHLHVTGKASLPITPNTESNFIIDAELTSFPAHLLNQYWPPKLEPPSRDWVINNIKKGTADKATLSIAGTILKTENNKIKLKELSNINGDIEFHGGVIEYLGKMPPVTEVKGMASYTKTDFNIVATEGKLNDISITAADVKISGLGTKPKIDIKIKGNGPLKTVLFAIEQEPLQYARLLEFDIENISGHTSGDLMLSFPLKENMSVKDIKVQANTKLTEVLIPNIIEKYNLTGGPFIVKINDQGMSINGDGMLDTAPISFTFQNNFNKSHDILHKIDGMITIPTNMLKSLVPIKPNILKVLSPNIATKFTYTELHDTKQSKLFLSANLTNTKILIPVLSWGKTNKSKSSISMFMHLNAKKTPYKISDLLIKLPNLYLEGNATLDKNKQGVVTIKKANIETFKIRDTKLSAKLRLTKNNIHRIEIKGSYIDITSFMNNKKEKKAKTRTKNLPFEIVIDADSLSIYKGQNIDKVKLFISTTEWGNINKLEIDGIAGKGKIYFRYLPKNNGRSLHFEADNAGAALAALGITKTVRGGKIVVKGEPVKGGNPYDLSGRAILSNFTIVKFPILARLLNALSPVGLQSLLSGEGIYFTNMKANFIWKKSFFANTQNLGSEIISINKGRTSGASLGLTFAGDINQTLDTIDISGTIVPISGLNKAIGEIPIIGDILTGGSDAVFAATYSIKGQKKEAKVTVNPLAALAPGFLRTIFFE